MNRETVDHRVTELPKPSCPFCRSAEVTTTRKDETNHNYWRCRACGEIWNQARLLSSAHRRR